MADIDDNVNQNNTPDASTFVPDLIPGGGADRNTIANYMRPPLAQNAPVNSGNIAQLLNTLRPVVSQGVGMGAAGLTAETGPGSLFARSQGYALTDMGMQQLIGLIRGNRPGIGESFLEGEKQAGVSEIGNQVIGGLVRGYKAFTNAGVPDKNSIFTLKPTASQALANEGHNALATMSKIFEDIFATGSKDQALDRSAGKGFAQAMRIFNAMVGRKPLNLDVDQMTTVGNRIKAVLTDAFEGDPYRPYPVKPTLQLPEKPPYPEAPTMPDKPQFYESTGEAEKARLTKEYNQQVADLRAGHKTRIAQIDAQHKTATASAQQSFDNEMQTYKSDLNAYNNPRQTIRREIMDKFENG